MKNLALGTNKNAWILTMCWTLSRCCDLLSRLLFVAACGQIFYLSFRKWDAVEAFCWHPPLMSVAVLLLYQEGVRTILRPNYRAHFLKLGREWSQYLQVPLSARDTSRRRRKYAAFVCAALVTLCAGFGCAAWSKHAVGLSAVWPLTTHSIFGAAAIVLLAVHGLSVCASLPPRKKVVAGGTPSNNSRRWAAHSEEKDHDDAKTGSLAFFVSWTDTLAANQQNRFESAHAEPLHTHCRHILSMFSLQVSNVTNQIASILWVPPPVCC